MDYQVILSPRAIQDLQEIVRYISFDNPVAAEKLGLQLIEKTRNLSAFPEMGRVIPELQNPLLRELIFKPYRIAYRVNHERHLIEVARYWHAARGTPFP
jgi:toxin ParE1/3/4